MFDLPGVTYVASSGDRGARAAFRPIHRMCCRSAPRILEADSAGNYIAEAAWSNPSNIVSATESGDVVTITTQNSTGAVVGNNVTVANVGLMGYNGDFKVSCRFQPDEFSYIDTKATQSRAFERRRGGRRSIFGDGSSRPVEPAGANHRRQQRRRVFDNRGLDAGRFGRYDGESLTAVGGSSRDRHLDVRRAGGR